MEIHQCPLLTCVQVRIRCAEPVCVEYDLCVPCFSDGKATKEHHPPTHRYQVIEQHSIPIFDSKWGADEEVLLLEGAETYDLGSWADIADHLGGYRDKDEVRQHYEDTYIESSKFPLPERASPGDKRLFEEIPRDLFQARKKRRIEERKEAAKNAQPSTPKQKPTASVPACHEVQGYMPGRLEFETEYFNEAEEAVQHMQFEPGDGINPQTGQLEPEMDLKMTVMDIYNNKLTARVERKKIIFEHRLLDARKMQAQDKKRSKEQRELFNKCKPFARMMKHEDFEEFTHDLEYELDLRHAIAQLQEWRQMRIGDFKSGEKYELEKQQRALRTQSTSTFDRLASSRMGKPAIPVDTPPVSYLTAPELPIKPVNGLHTPPTSASPTERVLTNGTGNIQPPAKERFPIQPLPGTIPMKFNNENAPDVHLLTEQERDVCAALRIMPKSYVAIKDHILKEAVKSGGALKKKAVREACKIDVNKGGKLFDFFVWSGWIVKG